MKPKRTLLHRGHSIEIWQIESEHFTFYVGEQEIDGKWRVVISFQVCRPEFLAYATQLQGKAMAEAHAAIQGAHKPPCDECLGKKNPDGPPCWKCQDKT